MGTPPSKVPPYTAQRASNAHSDPDFEEIKEKPAKRAKSRAKTSKKNDPRTQFDEPLCLDASYDDPEFRRWAAKETYVFLRQMKPDLLPWRWNDGVWSTNTPGPDGTLLGGCSYMQHNTGRANEDISKLVLRSVVNIYWECSRCSRTHLLYNATRGVLSLLGAGQLPKKDWVGYFTNGAYLAKICVNAECQEIMHLVIDYLADRRPIAIARAQSFCA